MPDTYMIVKWFDADRPIEIVERGLTLEQAKRHVTVKGQGAGWRKGFTKE